MLKPRILPCLLLQDKGLVKTKKFTDPIYVGDPINAVRIFNKKEADELVFLDIRRSASGEKIDLELISRLSDECFMPLAVGGGIREISEIKAILNTGVEKVIINTAFFENPKLVTEASEIFGSQSVVVSIDAKKVSDHEYRVFSRGGTKETKYNPVEAAKFAESMGAGEIMINSIDQDGMMEGFDLELIKSVTEATTLPVTVCGGAGSNNDLHLALEKGASAVAAGSLFVFYGPRQAVLINFPTEKEIEIIKKVKSK